MFSSPIYLTELILWRAQAVLNGMTSMRYNK